MTTPQFAIGIAADDNSRNRFGQALHLILTERQMRYCALAAQLGISPPLLTMRTRERNATPYFVDRVCLILALPPELRAQLHTAAARDRGYKLEV